MVRAIRMVRVFRVFKLGKYASGLDLFIKTLSLSMPALSVLAALILMILIVCSSMMYFAEHDNEAVYCTNSSIPVFALPRECHYDSIITTMWWAVVTMTTVGYGDAYPVTTAGRLLAGITMLCGVLIVALPVTVLSTNFSVVYAEWKLKNRVRLKHKAEQKKELRIAEEAEKARAAARAAGEADTASQSLGGNGDNGSSIGRLRFRRAARQALAKTKLKKVRSMPEEYMQPTPAEEFRCVLVTRTVHCPSRIDRHNICRECALPLGLIVSQTAELIGLGCTRGFRSRIAFSCCDFDALPIPPAPKETNKVPHTMKRTLQLPPRAESAPASGERCSWRRFGRAAR